MSRSTTVARLSDATALAAELLENDRRYFESAAVLEPAGGAVIAHVPGLERVAAGCVVQRVDPAVLPRDPARWLDGIEHRLLGLGSWQARFYVTGRHPVLEATLLARGYRPREELGFAVVLDGPTLAITRELPVLELRPVTTPDDWAAKVALHRLAGTGPDGHDSEPEAWVELERMRAEAGYMRPYFVVSRGAICGVVALAGGESLLRIKNLVVHPSWRRMGIGSAVVRRAHAIAWREGWMALGVFALAGHPGEQLYRGAGLEIVARQTEWMRPMNPRGDLREGTL